MTFYLFLDVDNVSWCTAPTEFAKSILLEMKLNSFCFGKSNILFVEAFLGVQVQMVTGSEQVAQLPF